LHVFDEEQSAINARNPGERSTFDGGLLIPRSQVRVYALDRGDEGLDRGERRARIGCDSFHLVCGANTALDTGRRERQREAPRFAWLRR
jgi:hypothetical protein